MALDGLAIHVTLPSAHDPQPCSLPMKDSKIPIRKPTPAPISTSRSFPAQRETRRLGLLPPWS